MIEHEVIVDNIGGATVISCKALDFNNIELMGKINEKDIRNTILRQKHIPADEPRADFVVKIIDNRPVEEENFNEKRRRESLEHKPKNFRL